MIMIKIAILVEKYNFYYWIQSSSHLITQIRSIKYVQKNYLAHDLNLLSKPDLQIKLKIFLSISEKRIKKLTL